MTHKERVDTNLCWALQCLRASGYTHEELAFMFECGQSKIADHTNEACDHAPFPGDLESAQPPLGDDLRALRVERDLSQAALARILDVSLTTVYKYEKGQAEPHPRNRQALLDFKRGDYEDPLYPDAPTPTPGPESESEGDGE